MKKVLHKWLREPRYRQAADIAQRLIALMMVLAGILALGLPPQDTGTLGLLEHSIFSVRGWAISSLICGFTAIAWPRPPVWVLVLLTAPILVFVYFSVLALLSGMTTGLGLVFIGLLYLVLLVQYWGAG